MRLISETDWADLFESVSLVDARLARAAASRQMDFPSRNLYRSAIEQLARGSDLSEIEVADRALALPQAASPADAADSRGDPGWHLIGGGRPAFEARHRLPPARQAVDRPLRGAGSASAAMSARSRWWRSCLVALALWAVWAREGRGGLARALGAGGVLLPRIERPPRWSAATSHGASAPRILPGLELKDGVPSELRTLVAVPTLLTGEDDLREQIDRLEVHYLSGAGGDLTFALLTDGLDAPPRRSPTTRRCLPSPPR